MVTQQVLASQRQHAKRAKANWRITLDQNKLWLWSTAWFKVHAALPKPAESLRYPGWMTGKHAWAGTQPWLETPYQWSAPREFSVEQSAGPQAYLGWDITITPLSPIQSELTFICTWNWSKTTLFKAYWERLQQQIQEAIPHLEALQKMYPVQNMGELRQAGKHVHALFKHLEPGLVLALTGTAERYLWQWIHEQVHENNFHARMLRRLPGGRSEVSHEWNPVGADLRIFFSQEHAKKETEPVYFPVHGLSKQRVVWPKKALAIPLKKQKKLCWQAGQSTQLAYLCEDPLAPLQRSQFIDEPPKKPVQALSPEGKQLFKNRGKAPQPLAFGKQNLPTYDLLKLFLRPAITPCLQSLWPENAPATMTLSLCLVATPENETFAPGVKSIIEDQLSTSRLVLFSETGLLMAFEDNLSMLEWLKNFYAQIGHWQRLHLVSKQFTPQVAVHRGEVQAYPQNLQWRMMGAPLRQLNTDVKHSHGSVVVPAQQFAQQDIQKWCHQNKWHVVYLRQDKCFSLYPENAASEVLKSS